MHLQEVDDAREAGGHQLIEKLGHRLELAVEREQVGDQIGRRLDQSDPGGFQRLEEPGRQPDRHAVLLPLDVAVADVELQHPRRQRV